MSRLEKILMHGGTLVLGITGIAYAVFKHLMVNDDPFSAYSHPLQPWMLAIHVLAAPVMVFAVGSIFKDHVLAGMRNGAPRGVRRAGLSTLALVIPLILSGYLIQVLSSGAPRTWSGWIHLGLGAAFLAFYVAHLAGVLRRAARGRTARSALGEGAPAPPATLWGRRRAVARVHAAAAPRRRPAHTRTASDSPGKLDRDTPRLTGRRPSHEARPAGRGARRGPPTLP